MIILKNEYSLKEESYYYSSLGQLSSECGRIASQGNSKHCKKGGRVHSVLCKIECICPAQQQ